ncbi:hypothetical protein GALMADRAFT_222247 [Galerina marginata CBS 339.88]|uniref:Uncharacterized protein n=1 Tax=Galerina marginata (strain CBS 339.88) TaxID=685588 RepID=A0A067TL58_GALM3|nr:hypothetical protein GALMADRAFT_222247 [Galerina marginata CBS 339.88]
MGLLKRLFSIGSKKNKKQRLPIVHDVPLPEQSWTANPTTNDEEHEAAVGRLLRSSSARFVEQQPGLDYATLPPLPHPINRVIQTPASSTVSLESASLSQRGTYNVTVHKRKRHASTELPNVDGEASDKARKNEHRTSLHPVEDSRVLRLRSDPSVASLLDLYDEHGKLSQDAFSNSPPTSPNSGDGRAQVRRNGSTLRQLLGATSSLNSRNGDESGSAEGDISWAERFLAETEATSSKSSLDLRTPITPKGDLPEPEISFMTEGSMTNTTFDNPAISSMEVELSMSIDVSQDMDDLYKKNSPYQNSDPSTPQRASQVFGFLTRGKQSKPVEDLDRSLPELPSCFSSPTDENGEVMTSQQEPPKFQFNPTRFSVIPIPHIDDTPKPSRPHSVQLENSSFAWESTEPRSTFSDDSHDPHYVPKSSFPVRQNAASTKPISATDQEEKKNAIKVLMNGPTKVIVTAPTPSTNHDGPSRLPRGPRALPRKLSSSHRRRSALVELSNSSSSSVAEPFTVNPSRRKPHKRSSSQSSSHSLSRSTPYEQTKKTDMGSQSAGNRKENQLGLSVKAELPSTPLRTNTTGSHSLLRSVVEQAMFRPPVGMTPSPASSSEMSPVGRQMMMDVRQQRMKAREADRVRYGSERTTQRI